MFVVTAEANAGLVKVLPGLLAQVQALVGKRRLTVVFDRGGYSPKLFAQTVAAGFDFLTYRKGRFPRVARKHFRVHQAVRDGRRVSQARTTDLESVAADRGLAGSPRQAAPASSGAEHHLRARRQTRAIAALCEELNQTQTLFPGSNLLLCYAIRDAS